MNAYENIREVNLDWTKATQLLEFVHQTIMVLALDQHFI